MTSHITTPCLPQVETEATAELFDSWFDPVEAGLRDRAREFLQAMLEAELDEGLGRSRYAGGLLSHVRELSCLSCYVFSVSKRIAAPTTARRSARIVVHPSCREPTS
jgi:hypothetical protein